MKIKNILTFVYVFCICFLGAMLNASNVVELEANLKKIDYSYDFFIENNLSNKLRELASRTGTFDNLVRIEHILMYENADRWEYSQILSNAYGTKKANVSSSGVAMSMPGAFLPAGSGAGGPPQAAAAYVPVAVGEGVGFNRIRIDNFKRIGDSPKFAGSVNGKGRLSSGVNATLIQSYPFIGKYFNEGARYATPFDFSVDTYIFTDLLIVIENNYSTMQANIPASVKAAISSKGVLQDNVEFYTEVVNWGGEYVPFDAAPNNMAGMNRGFNILFHGALADWYLGLDWNFDTQGVSKSLPMGLFEVNGISQGDSLPINSLAALAVNPHNGAFSPSNAIFKVNGDRNIVSFWSVATSVDGDDLAGGKKAIVTYHVLINQESYKDLVSNVQGIASRANTLTDLFINLSDIDALPVGADGAAWGAAIEFLSRLYRV